MANTPDTSRNIFSAAKRYFGQRLQEGVPIFDWDVNETSDEMVWHIIMHSRLMQGDFGYDGFRTIRATDDFSFAAKASGAVNNLDIYGGTAFVAGRLVYNVADFTYDEDSNTPTNYIVKNAEDGLTDITETTPGTDYTIEDTEQNFTDDHDLVGATLRFTSGALSGTEFTIAARVSATELQITDDLSTALAGDTYVIKPRPLETPVGAQTDTFTLVTWWEDIGSTEDPDLIDLTPLDTDLHVEPSHRRQLRWCVYANWTGSDGSDTLDDFFSLELFDLDRIAAEDTVDAEDITEVDNFVPTFEILKELVIDHQTERMTGMDRFVWDIGNPFRLTLSGNFGDYDENITLDDCNIFDGRYTLLDDNYKMALTGLGFTNAETSNYSFSKLTIASDGESFSTSDGETGAIADNELAYLSLASAGDSDLIQVYPMGEIADIKGFNWFAQNGTGGGLTVTQGQLRYFGGKLLQLPEAVDLTLDDSANLLTSGAFTGVEDWVYIYLVHTVASGRKLDVAIDLVEPLEDGRHPYPGAGKNAYCIGFVYFDSGDEPYYECAGTPNGKVVFPAFTNGFNVINRTAPTGTGSYSDDLDVPKGARFGSFNIRGANNTSTTLTVSYRHQYSGNTYVNDAVVADFTIDGIYENFYVTVPLSNDGISNTNRFITDYNTWSAGSVSAVWKEIDFEYR